MRVRDLKIRFIDDDTGEEMELDMVRMSVNRTHNSMVTKVEIEAGGVPKKTGIFHPTAAKPIALNQGMPGAPVNPIPVPGWVKAMIPGYSDPDEAPTPANISEFVGISCQCGKEKHGFAKHAYWCDIKD